MQQSPIFVRTYDFLHWLLPATAKFPRQHRFILAEQLQRKAFELQDSLVQAGLSSRAGTALNRADCALASLRIYLRLAHDLNLLSHRRYEHAAGMLIEIGNLLGGWKKSHNAGDGV